MMLPVSGSASEVFRESAIIVDDYDVLIGGQDPILFTGLNKYGARILGTFVDEDSDEKLERFLQVQVTSRQYLHFMRGELSYLQLLNDSQAIFLVDESFDRERVTVHAVTGVSAVPAPYLPLEGSIVPPPILLGGPEYVHKLDGPRAALSRASPKDLSVILNSFPGALAQPAKPFASRGSTISPEVLGFKPGSFEVHFSLNPARDPQMDLFAPPLLISEYVRRYIDYCLNFLPKEAAQLASGQPFEAPNFHRLLEMQSEALQRTTTSDPAMQRDLIKSLELTTKSFNEIASLIGGNVTSITLLNGPNREWVGVIDKQSSEEFEATLAQIEPINTKLTKDASAKPYTILVYAINRETRKGSAYVVADNKHMPRSRIVIGEKLDISHFTENFHLERTMSVNGIATRSAAGAITSLSVESLAEELP